MQSRSPFSRLFLVFGLVFVLSSTGQAVVPNRIASVAAESRASLPHTVSPRVRNATDLGSTPEDRVLDSLTLRFNMTAAQQAALTQLLNDQQNPNSPRYHQWLTPEQFGAQFGLSSADIAKVSSWLTSQGFTITDVARSSTFINFKGTVAQVQKAFHTSIHNLSLNGEQHFSNTGDVALPASIAGVVSTISGLNNFRLRARATARTVKADLLSPQYTSSASGAHYIAPGDFYTIYDVNPLLSNSINGSGVGAGKGGGYSIAVMGQVDISLSDVAAFRSASGLSANLPTVVLAGADPGAATSSTSIPSTNDLAEAQLDVEWSGAVAPSAKIAYVNSKDVINLSIPYAVDRDLAPIISVSYGECEPLAGVSGMDAFSQLFQQANVEGITIVGPSGDSGATDCDYRVTTATQGLAVDFPGSSPFVTAAGGTMFNEGSATGATSYWSGSNGSNAGSATGYIPETVWNESNSTSGLGAGGGGASIFYTKPSWQTGPGVPVDNARDVPDISLNAAAGHDGYLFCLQGSCTNGYRDASGDLRVVGGTSVAAPSFAGILALVEQQNNFNGIGNANPMIYGLANSTYSNTIFHDIASGNNASPCEIGTPNCPNGGSIGYNAGPDYDQASGWGTIDAYNLATKWKLAAPILDSGATHTISATSVSTTNSLCAVSGGSLALTATVVNGTFDSNGNPVIGTTPTGTVQFMVDNTAVGTPVALVNGKASYTLDTTALASGARTVSAVYSGDSFYAGSRGTLLDSDGLPVPVDVVSSSSADFSITPCTASTSAASGGNAPGVVFTLMPFHNFSGNVTLSLSSDQPVAATYTLSTGNTVNLNSSAGTPFTLTLMAYQSNATTSTGRLRMASSRPPVQTMPWYVRGSGAALACVFLFVVPRRRRWGAILAVVLTVGAMGASGCGSSSSSSNSGGGGNSGPSNPVTNAAAGTYNITITAMATTSNGNLVHTAHVLFTVR